MEFNFKGQSVIITGGTAGIGRQIAKSFAAQGAQVIIGGTNTQRGQEVVSEIHQQFPGALATFYPFDVANHQQTEQFVKQVTEKYGKIDILVNNAGITRDQLMMKMSEEEWDTVLDTNLKSCFNLCKALIRPMMKQRKGKIINISSVIGLTGNAGQVNYASSKAGMIGFTKALAKEVASRGINVNCIAPGFIQTPMTEVLTEEKKKEILNSIPMSRMGAPDDIAYAVMFLASTLSDYITGQVLTVDGGMVM